MKDYGTVQAKPANLPKETTDFYNKLAEEIKAKRDSK